MAESNVSHSTNTDNRHYLIPAEILQTLITMGHHKAHLPMWQTFLGSLYAGAYVVFGGMVALSTGGGLDPTTSAANPAYAKLLTGLTFWIALILIITYGGELFTGNLMYLSLARISNKITTFEMLKNWLIVFVGNYMACGFFAYILGYVGDFYSGAPYLTYVQNLAVHKCNLYWQVAFVRGIGANWMVCCGVVFSVASQEQISRMFACFFPIFLFATVGFEHSIANMFYVSIGEMYGANVTLGQFWSYNLIPVALGNLVGALFCGLGLYFLNLEDQKHHSVGNADIEQSNIISVLELKKLAIAYITNAKKDSSHLKSFFTKRYKHKSGTILSLNVECVVEVDQNGTAHRILSLLRGSRGNRGSAKSESIDEKPVDEDAGFLVMEWDGVHPVEDCQILGTDFFICRLLGYTMSEFLNMKIKDITFSGDSHLATALLKETIRKSFPEKSRGYSIEESPRFIPLEGTIGTSAPGV